MEATESENVQRIVMTFRGPAVDDGKLEVEDFSDSVEALSQLFQIAGRHLNGTKVQLKVVGTEAGSFSIILDLILVAGQSLVLNYGATISTLDTISKAIFGSSKGGLMGLLGIKKWLNGAEVSVKQNNGQHRLETSNQQIILENNTINNLTINMMQTPAAHKGVERMVSPLKHEGYEEMEVRASDDEKVEIKEANLFAFRAPEVPVVSTERIMRRVLKIMGLDFEPGKHWRFHDEDGDPLKAIIFDHAFYQSLGRRVFRPGDLLDCEVSEVDTFKKDSKTRTTYTVLKVHGHWNPSDVGVLFQS